MKIYGHMIWCVCCHATGVTLHKLGKVAYICKACRDKLIKTGAVNICDNGGRLRISEWDKLNMCRRKKAKKMEDAKMKPILDACCGARLFWFDKHNPNAIFCDNRTMPYCEYYPKRYIEIKPDTVCDFTSLPFPDKSFKLVVFDPPHLIWAGPKSWMALKYGRLDANWPQMIHDGFWECMRVLDDYGTLIFKWSEVQIPLRDVLKAIQAEPLFGHRSGKRNNTHWLCFMKFPE